MKLRVDGGKGLNWLSRHGLNEKAEWRRRSTLKVAGERCRARGLLVKKGLKLGEEGLVVDSWRRRPDAERLGREGSQLEG